MAYLLAEPQMMATAAADIAGIGSAIDEANVTAAGSTTSMAAAAADEVSAATATLFNTFAQEWHAFIRNAATALDDHFPQAMAASANAYAEAEAAASAGLGALTMEAKTLLAPLIGGGPATVTQPAPVDPPPVPVNLALIMGPSGVPTPSLFYAVTAYNNYISPHFTTSLGNLEILSTPEGLYPITGVKDLTLAISVDRGLETLTNAINLQIGLGNAPFTVFGYSQSAILSALELPILHDGGYPTSDVSFVLVGNEMTPNGGMLARFPNLNIASVGLPFYGGMDANTGFSVFNYTLEYDGFADFPQYPIDALSDLNAVFGLATVHTQYMNFMSTDLPPGYSLVTQPTTPGYSGGTTYYMITSPTDQLPLVRPLYTLPIIGKPLADLLAPDLQYLVNWGYGDPNYGYSTGPANITTPVGLFPPLSAFQGLGPDLVTGTHEGIIACSSDFRAEGISLPTLPLSLPPVPAQPLSLLSSLASQPLSLPSLPTLPLALPSLPPHPLALPSLSGLSLSGIADALKTVALPTATPVIDWLKNAIVDFTQFNSNIVYLLSSDLSTAFSVVPPTVDLGIALFTTLPSYDTNVFLAGIYQMLSGEPVAGLFNAIGLPIGVTAGLATVSVGVEFLVLLSAAQTLIYGVPHPAP